MRVVVIHVKSRMSVADMVKLSFRVVLEVFDLL
jgi:hypothetical protein